MILTHYTNPNKPPEKKYGQPSHLHNGTAWASYYANKLNISVEEFIRRDNVFREESKTVSFVAYDIVYPRDYKQYTLMGKCTVSKIIRSYSDPDAVWPDRAGSVPMVIEVKADLDQKIWNCTANFFQRVPPVKPLDWDEPKGTIDVQA